MKKFILLLILAIVTFSYGFSQNEHEEVFGISFNNTLSQFTNELAKKGFTFNKIDEDGSALFNGNIGKDKVILFEVFYTPISKKISTVYYSYGAQKYDKVKKTYEKLYKENANAEGFSSNSNSFSINKHNAQGIYGVKLYSLEQFSDGRGYISVTIGDSLNTLLGYEEHYGKDVYPVKSNVFNFMGINFAQSKDVFSKNLIANGFNEAHINTGNPYMERFNKDNWGPFKKSVQIEVTRMIKEDSVWMVKVKSSYIKDYEETLNNLNLIYHYKYGIGKIVDNNILYTVRNIAGEDIGRISLEGDEKNHLIEVSYADTKLGKPAAIEINEWSNKLKTERQKRDSEDVYKLANDGKFHFTVNNDGTFTTVDGRPFYVIQKGKQRAHSIYLNLLDNASRLYINPDKVISGVPDQTLVINGMAKDVSYAIIQNMRFHYDVFYRLEIQIKDGRIKVNQPLITQIGVDQRDGLDGEVDYDVKQPNEVMALRLGDSDFKKNINNKINAALNNIVFGIKGEKEDNW